MQEEPSCLLLAWRGGMRGSNWQRTFFLLQKASQTLDNKKNPIFFWELSVCDALVAP